MNILKFLLVLLMPVIHVTADVMLLNPRDPATPIKIVSPPDTAMPLGIEGNGLLGIEGNGIMQRVGTTEFVVNDTLYQPGSGTVRVKVDARHAPYTRVQPGQVLTVKGAVSDTATAIKPLAVSIDHLIRGVVDLNDSPSATLQILGQTLLISESAALSDVQNGAPVDLELAEFLIGDFVNVSGFVNADGDVLVTRVERSLNIDNVFEASGRIDTLDVAAQTLVIDDLTVDYSTAQFVYMTPAQLSEHQLVEVVGNGIDDNNMMIASRVRPLAQMQSHSVDQAIELQGFVDAQINSEEFLIAGQNVHITPSTQFRLGNVEDLGVGRFVEVEGDIDQHGKIVADSIEFEEDVLESAVRLFGRIDNIDTMSNELEVMGITVLSTVATDIDSRLDSDPDEFSFTDLEVDDFVQVRAYENEDGNFGVTATRIRVDESTDTSIRAAVSANSGSSISILGLNVLTDSATVYENAAGDSISAAEFFMAATVGTLVKVYGDVSGSEIDATHLELE